MSEIFIQTFFLYFIVIDPLGNTPLFLSITQNMDTNKKIRIALSATIIASIILLFFALLGSALLSYLNISYPAFTIGGGIILLIIAIEMLFDKRQQRKEEDIDLNSDNVSVFPLATPIIAGPAAITSVIVSVSDIGTNFTNQTAGMFSLVSVLFLTFIIFFTASKFSKIINKKIIGVKNLILNHKELEETRKELAFVIDGIVYKVNDYDLQKRLGFAANAPRWAIAHKFSANSSISEIMNIEIQIGRTGALTPVAKIKPVNIGGVIVSNATLHNEDEIVRKDIRVGDTVTVERAGDVIPHVVLVDLKKRKQNSKKFIFPLKCPSCGSKTIKDYNEITKRQDAVRRCASEGFECEKIAIERIKHFVSKDAFNIDGFGKKIVENFWNLKLVRLPQDIFSLNYNKIEELEGWGKLSVANLKFSIEEKKSISLERLFI